MIKFFDIYKSDEGIEFVEKNIDLGLTFQDSTWTLTLRFNRS